MATKSRWEQEEFNRKADEMLRQMKAAEVTETARIAKVAADREAQLERTKIILAQRELPQGPDDRLAAQIAEDVERSLRERESWRAANPLSKSAKRMLNCEFAGFSRPAGGG